MKILAIGAHADDIELGCGGALLGHQKAGHQIHILILTHSGYRDLRGHERRQEEATDEAVRNAAALGATIEIAKFEPLTLSADKTLVFRIQEVVHKFNPTRVYTMHIEDTHLDHVATARASMPACKNVDEVLMYQTNLNPTPFAHRPSFYVDISPYIEDKVSLIRQFRSEAPKLDAWEEIVRVNARTHGFASGANYAEAYWPVKMLEHR